MQTYILHRLSLRSHRARGGFSPSTFAFAFAAILFYINYLIFLINLMMNNYYTVQPHFRSKKVSPSLSAHRKKESKEPHLSKTAQPNTKKKKKTQHRQTDRRTDYTCIYK